MPGIADLVDFVEPPKNDYLIYDFINTRTSICKLESLCYGTNGLKSPTNPDLVFMPTKIIINVRQST